jgi:hypothetical protein
MLRESFEAFTQFKWSSGSNVFHHALEPASRHPEHQGELFSNQRGSRVASYAKVIPFDAGKSIFMPENLREGLPRVPEDCTPSKCVTSG